MAGLFGMTPEEQRVMDLDEGQMLMKAGQQLGGGMLMYAPSMGRMQSESIMGALQGMGVSTPSQRKEEQVKDALQGLDYNNPASMMEAARKLLDLGMTAEAQQLVKAAQDAQTALLTKQEKESAIGRNLAQANLYGAQSQKALASGDKEFAVDAQLAQLDAALENGVITQEQHRLGYQNVLRANEKLNAANIGKINRSGYNTDVNTMLGLGGTSVQNVGAGLTPEADIPQSDIDAIQAALRIRLAGQGKGSTTAQPDFKKAMGLTAETLNTLNSTPQASSYLMGAQQLFSEGKVDEAMNLVNYAKQSVQIAGDETVAVKDDAIIRDVNKSTEKLSLQSLGLNQITTILNNPENFNNPKLMQTLASQLTSATSQTAIRALAEVEGLRNAEELVATVQDFISKLGTGTITNESILKYKEAASELQKAVSENKAKVMSGKIEQYSKTGMLKSEAKVPSFLSGFGMSGATVVSDDSGGKPNGYYKKDKDGNIYVVVNGKVYKGRM
jgi:cellobiose-specific phosphotransferase system component IIA